MSIVRYNYPNIRSLVPAFGFSSRNPWPELESEIDRLFAATLSGLPGETGFPVELSEDKDNTYVRAELPGVKREDLKIEALDNVLTITASRKQKGGENAELVSFSRSVSVPEAQADKITAAYADGVLTLTLPKREAAKPQPIAVN